MVDEEGLDEKKLGIFKNKTPFMSTSSIKILVILFLFVACTTRITKIKNPVFATPIDSLQTGLNALVVSEHINIDGKEITTNGKPSSELEIDIINGRNIPGDTTGRKALAHSLAVELKNALKDKNEYDNYTVLFVKVVSSGAMTKRSWIGQEFKSGEL